MEAKILVLLLLGVSLLAFGCAGKKAEAPPTIGSGEQTGPAANDTADDSEDGADENETDDDGAAHDANNDSEVGTNTSGKNISDLADLFKIDTDKPLEGEGLDVETPESNES